MKPNTTCTPARSRSRAQRILASSSKRAFSSTSAVTDLPASAASASALMIGRVGRGAVERLPDGDDVGIARRLQQEVHHHIEGFERMVDDEILLPDRGKAVAAVIAHAFGIARRIRHEFEIRPMQVGDLAHLVEREHTVDAEHAVVGGAERPLHEAAQLHGHGRFDVEADHDAAAAALERGLEHPHQIFGFFQDLDFGVAGDAERAEALHRITGKQLADEKAGHAFNADQTHFAAVAAPAAGAQSARAGWADGSARSSPCRPWRGPAARRW